MEDFERFNELPIEIRDQILHESGAYTIASEYMNNYMNTLKEERCMDMPTVNEILRAIRNGIGIVIVSRNSVELIRNQREYYMVYEEGIKNLRAGNNESMLIVNSVKVNGNYLQFRDIESRMGESGYRFDRLLFLPNDLGKLFRSRGEMCQKHIDEFKYKYIMYLYETLGDSTEFKLYAMMAILDAEDKLDSFGTNRRGLTLDNSNILLQNVLKAYNL